MQNKLIVLAIFLLVLVSAGVVSAADDSTDNTANIENTTENVLDLENQEDNLKLNTGSFLDLNDKINGNQDSEIYLDVNYVYDSSIDADFSDGVVINRSVTIYGNGITIDGSGGARIFNVTADNVILKDIVFVNGKADNGGAIFWSSSTAGIYNCCFVNNTATWGGANCFDSKLSNVNITGEFINNRASYGGANYFNSEIINVRLTGNFTNNTAKSDGGANYFYNELTDVLICGNFISNSAGNDGGANYFYKTMNDVWISGEFMENNAVGMGGANFFWGTLNNVSIFGNFSKHRSMWAAVNCFIGVLNNVNLTGNFRDNVAIEDAGANLFLDNINDVVISGNFINNSANGASYNNGGAVNYFSGNLINVDLTGNFADNVVRDSSVNFFLYSIENVTLSGNFVNNTAKSVINIKNLGLGNIICDSIFIDNDVDNIVSVSSGSIYAVDNWFGGNSTNYVDEPAAGNVTLGNWLFLKGNATNNPISLINPSGITFKLYRYNSTLNNESDYDNNLLQLINLAISSVNGDVDKDTVILAETVEYMPTSVGNGCVTASFGSVQDTIEIEIHKESTTLEAASVTSTYNINKNLVVSLRDSNNNPVIGVKITIKLSNGKTYEPVTDSMGQAKISTQGLAPKTYTASITFEGNDCYEKSSKSVKIVVKKATPKLIASKKTFKKVVLIKKYTVTLKNNLNKVMKNAYVTLKVNKKTYKVKTNAKGQAIFKITNLNKKGTFTAVVKYSGNKYYTAKTVKPKITVK